MAEPNQLSSVIGVPSKSGAEIRGGAGKREKIKFLKKQPGGVRCSYCGIIGFHRYKGRFIRCPRKTEILAKGKQDSEDPIQEASQMTADAAVTACPSTPHAIGSGCSLTCISNGERKWADEMEQGTDDPTVRENRDDMDVGEEEEGSEMSESDASNVDESEYDDEADYDDVGTRMNEEELKKMDESDARKKAYLEKDTIGTSGTPQTTPSEVGRASISRTDGSLASWAGRNIFIPPVPMTHTESTPSSSPAKIHIVKSGLFEERDPRNFSSTPSPTPKHRMTPFGLAAPSPRQDTPLSYVSVPTPVTLKPVTPPLTNKNLPKDLDKTPTSPNVIRIHRNDVPTPTPVTNTFIGEGITSLGEFERQIHESKKATEEMRVEGDEREETPCHAQIFTAERDDVEKVRDAFRKVSSIYHSLGPARWTNPDVLVEPLMDFVFGILRDDWSSHQVRGLSIQGAIMKAGNHLQAKAAEVCKEFGVDWDNTCSAPPNQIIMEGKEIAEAREQIRYVKTEAKKLAEMTEEQWMENHKRLEEEAKRLFRQRKNRPHNKDAEDDISRSLGIVDGKAPKTIKSIEPYVYEIKAGEGIHKVPKGAEQKAYEGYTIVRVSPCRVGLPKPITVPSREMKKMVEEGEEKKEGEVGIPKKIETKNVPQEKKDAPKKKLTFAQMAVNRAPTNPTPPPVKGHITPEIIKLAKELKVLEPETPIEKFVEMLRSQAPSPEEKKKERVPFKVIQQRQAISRGPSRASLRFALNDVIKKELFEDMGDVIFQTNQGLRYIPNLVIQSGYVTNLYVHFHLNRVTTPEEGIKFKKIMFEAMDLEEHNRQAYKDDNAYLPFAPKSTAHLCLKGFDFYPDPHKRSRDDVLTGQKVMEMLGKCESFNGFICA